MPRNSAASSGFKIPLLDARTSRRLMEWICLAFICLGTINFLSTFATLYQHRDRPLGIVGIGLYGGLILMPSISLLLIRSNRILLASRLTLWSGWLIILIGAPFGSGNRSVGIFAIPLLIFMLGWLDSPRQAVRMGAASVLALLGISLSEHFSWLTMIGPIPPLARWCILAAAVALTTWLTVQIQRLVLRRYHEQQHLAATLEMVTEHSPIMLASVAPDGLYRYVNRNYAAFFGKTPLDLLGTPATGHLGARTEDQMNAALSAGKGATRYRFRCAAAQQGQEECWLAAEIQRASQDDGSPDGYHAILRDVSAEVRAEERIEYLAYHDALTGLPNRQLLSDRLSQALSRAVRDDSLVAVCYVDLDRFRLINDTWGHTIGDQILLQVAQRLQQALRGTDTVARLGGDEFLVLLGGFENRQEPVYAVERLLNALNAPVQIGQDRSINISTSMGVALFPFDGEEADVLLRRADQAMLMAKQSGRRCYALADASLQDRIHTLHQLPARVAAGLDAGEFALHFQPMVNMRDGSVFGAEALIRWFHPEQGLLLPASFLPYVEGSSVEARLGQWALQEALTQLDRWQAGGLELKVHVNLSGGQLQEPDFLAGLSAMLQAHPTVPAGRLTLEVPESSAVTDVEKIARVMRACRSLGIQFVLDDFGAGQASITSFRRLPAVGLKLHSAFIADVQENPEDLSTVCGIIALAQSFGRQLIAEGVETIEQGTTLLRLGCERAQGHAIAHPMPADELPGWVRTWRRPECWQQT